MKLFLKFLLFNVMFALIVCTFTGVQAEATITDSGVCGTAGNNLTWTLDSNGQLTISGAGDMQDFHDTLPPWSDDTAKITSLVIENGVTNIGASAFAGCGSLTNAVIPDSVTVIGSLAFSGCEKLPELPLPSSLERIGELAFQNCSSLTAIVLPVSLQRVESNAFVGCSALTRIDVDKAHAYYTSIDGILYLSGGTQLMICPGGLISGSFTVPGSVRMIGAYAFCDCDGLTDITFPEELWSIGSHAFASCESLSSITIPYISRGISAFAFDECDALTDVHFTGTQDEWNQMQIGGEGNGALLGATLHFDEDEPALAAPTLTLLSSGTAGQDVTIQVSGPEECDFIDGEWYFYLDGAQGTVTIPGFHFPSGGSYTICAYSGKKITLDDGSTDWIYSDEGVLVVDLPEPENGMPGVPDVVFSSLEADYGNEAADLTFTIPGAEAVSYLSIWEEGGGWPDEIIESSTAHPLTALSEPGLWKIRVFGRFDGVWSDPSDHEVWINALGHMEEPVIQWNGTPLASNDLTINLDASLNFTIVSENAEKIWYLVSRVEGEFDPTPLHAEGVYIPWGGSDPNYYVHLVDTFENGTTLSLDLSKYHLEPGVYRLFIQNQKAGWEYNTAAVWLHLVPVAGSILDLPDDLTTIESQAFANLNDADAVRIPSSVTSIAADAFSGSDLVLLVPYGSYAEAWARDPDHPVPCLLE